MINRKEGYRRLSIAAGLTSAATWIVYVFVASRGFDSREMRGNSWAVFVLGIVCVYLVAWGLVRLGFWVYEGFASGDSSGPPPEAEA